MTKHNTLILGMLLISQIVIARQKDFASELEGLMINMKKYTMEVAEQMPEDKFEYKPSESEEFRAFSRHLKHIGNFIGFQLMIIRGEEINDLRGIIAQNREYELSATSREEVLEYLSGRFDEVIDYFKTTTDRNLDGTFTFYWEPDKPVRSRKLIAMALRDHISHHRAQAIVYLRENGIVPARYQRY